MDGSERPTTENSSVEPHDRSWLTRNVKVLSAVSLAQDAASELLYPLMPIFITGVLGAPAAVVGAIEGIAEGVSAALKYLSGRWSDRFGRKPAVAAGYGLAAAGKVIIAVSASWTTVLLGRVVDRIGKGVRGAPRDALLAAGVPTRQLGRVFGFHRAADTIGAVLGPLIGLAILEASDGNIRTALWFAVIPAVMSVLLVGLTTEQRRKGRDSTHSSLRHAQTRTEMTLGPVAVHKGVAAEQADRTGTRLPGRVRAVAALLSIFAVVNFPDALLLLRLSDIGFGPAEVLASYTVFNAASAAIAYPAGRLSDRWPRHRVYALGLGCFAIGYAGLGATNAGPIALLLLICYGGFAGITDGVGKAWISALCPPDLRGHAQGLFQALSGIGILIAGLWAGAFWEIGPGLGVVPLLISGCVAAVAAVGLWVFGNRIEPPVNESTEGR